MDRLAIIGRSARPPDDNHTLRGERQRGNHSGGATKVLGSSKTQVLRWRSRPGKFERLPRAGFLITGRFRAVCGCSLRTQQGAR